MEALENEIACGFRFGHCFHGRVDLRIHEDLGVPAASHSRQARFATVPVAEYWKRPL